MTISLFRSIAGQFQDLRAVSTVPMMNAISHLIEDQVIDTGMPVDLYTGFQRFSCFPDQMRRYGRLGATCRRVYVVGVPDVRPPRIPGVEFIAIAPTSPLAREWFLVVDTPNFWTALLTQEVPGRDSATGGRRYDGIWSYNPQVVERASLLLSQLMGTVYQPVMQRNYEQQNEHIAAIGGRLLGKLERSRETTRRRWARLCTLHKMTESLAKVPPLPTLLVHNCPTYLLHDAVEVLQTILGARSVAVVLNDQGDEYAVAVADGADVVNARSVRAGRGPTGRAIAGGHTVLMHAHALARDPDQLVPSATSLVAAPIVGRKRVYGALTVAAEPGTMWDEEDVQTINTLAGMLAVIIEQRVSGQADPAQVAHVRQLQRAIVSLRRPIGHLMQLQQRLRTEGGLTPTQQELMGQIDLLTVRLAQSIGVSPAAPLKEHAQNE